MSTTALKTALNSYARRFIIVIIMNFFFLFLDADKGAGGSARLGGGVRGGRMLVVELLAFSDGNNWLFFHFLIYILPDLLLFIGDFFYCVFWSKC